jgi:glutaryl-CoA dehydrogenase
MWITNGSIAKVAIVWAKTVDGIRAFLVEAGTPGFRATLIKRKFAYRTSPTSVLELKDCSVGEEALLPGARGLKSILQCLNTARTLRGSLAAWRSGSSPEKELLDKPIASYQLVQERLVNMVVEITKGTLRLSFGSS